MRVATKKRWTSSALVAGMTFLAFAKAWRGKSIEQT